MCKWRHGVTASEKSEKQAGLVEDGIVARHFAATVYPLCPGIVQLCGATEKMWKLFACEMIKSLCIFHEMRPIAAHISGC
jgi:hypothetical protein